MMIQLNPPIPLSTPKGEGLAWIMIDYGCEHHLMWVVAISETGEIWTFSNPEVRATKNITMGRTLSNKNGNVIELNLCKKEYNDVLYIKKMFYDLYLWVVENIKDKKECSIIISKLGECKDLINSRSDKNET